ncbi:hypothetical protein [Oceanospirillum sediminis]|uniref:Uncharacterized protein n=1 Tax=Oceanospirillum sediminis TaxID=2760088 RepID=A0A839IZ87_9GAMM|nr:hypothetical protein [Oceanospirillum sediminis]MBB1489416.1 hypothetical protein [Oceanospirillum sediminis]
MTNRQLIFGLISGLVIAISGAFLAKENVITWLLSMAGSAMIVLNLIVWLMTRKSQQQKSAMAMATVTHQPEAHPSGS